MTTLHKIDEVTARIESETFALQLHLATRMLQRALLELRYNPTQPRLPSGKPGGGQFTYGPAGTASPSARRVAQGMGRQTFSGGLVSQQPTGVPGKLLCTYHDSRADYRFTLSIDADKCPSGYINY